MTPKIKLITIFFFASIFCADAQKNRAIYQTFGQYIIKCPIDYQFLKDKEITDYFNQPLRQSISCVLKKKNNYIGIIPTEFSGNVGFRNEELGAFAIKVNKNLLEEREFMPYDTLHPIIVSKKHCKEINADSALIRFGTRIVSIGQQQFGFAVITILKTDFGAISLSYTYKIGDRKAILKEIEKTWGIVSFMTDNEILSYQKKKRDVLVMGKHRFFHGKYYFLNSKEAILEDSLLYQAKLEKQRLK